MRRAASALAALASAALAGATLAPAARGIAIPTDPDNPAVAEQWANPAIRAGEGERATVELLSGPESIGAHDPVNVTLRVTNTSETPLDDLSVTPRRGPATGSVRDQRAATVAEVSEYSVVGRSRDVGKRLAPGESTEVSMEILDGELPLPGLATYPLLFALSAGGELLDTDRFHLTVSGAADGPTPGLSTLFPVSAPVDIVPGETGQAPDEAPLILSSENLADQLAPGGRLDTLLDVYSDATAEPAVAQATCMSLDPALVDTVARMAEGYRVSESRPDVVEEPKRLRDSWGAADTAPDSAPGRGAADAAAWLERVTQIAATGCVVALPWANADLNAVARTGDVWLMREALERGPFTLDRVLGTSGLENVVISGTGYVDPAAAEGLGWADHGRSTIASEGMNGAWEKAQEGAGQAAGGRIEGDQRAALDRPDLPGPAGVAAPAPETPVRALVAAGTAGARFSWLSPGVMAVEYQDDLASTLAAVGPHPETTGYSAEELRYDLQEDSQRARAVNAASAARLAVASARAEAGEGEPEPVLLNPPAAWDAADAATLMGAVRDLLASPARAVSLEDYLAPGADEEVGPAAPAGTLGALGSDPSAYADSEILAAGQQARFINDLSALLIPDPAIALTRYGFTLPLRRDLLVALSATGRRARDFYPEAEQATRARLASSRDTLNELRSSVALIPPGNVYTRASSSSPLLIVAENGLPLPVDSTILYTGPEGASLDVPGTLRIPAHGSVTAQLTADLPDTGGTDLTLFLASPQGVPISQPVDITVRTAGIALRGKVLLAALAVALALLLLFGIGRRRRARPPTRRSPHRPPQRPPRGPRQQTERPTPPPDGQANRLENPSP